MTGKQFTRDGVKKMADAYKDIFSDIGPELRKYWGLEARVGLPHYSFLLLEAMHPDSTNERRAELDATLRRYCWWMGLEGINNRTEKQSHETHT